MIKKLVLVCSVSAISILNSYGQDDDFTAVRAEVDFSHTLQDWDGFGFNYVETAHTYDYKKFAQEYGGFSLLNEKQKQEIIDLVFGAEGLKVGLVKMFLGGLHQQVANGPYDHESYTSNMRYFVKQGLQKTRARGGDLSIITTMYSPPGYVTNQQVGRGRDLDPKYANAVADYMVSWARFLVQKEKLPLKYISLHNEGEDWSRWTKDGFTNDEGHDYNMYWPPEQVVNFLKLMPAKLIKAGLPNVSMTPGENTNWYRFYYWGYANAIAHDALALKNLGLITSHGFYVGKYGPWFGEHNSVGNDVLRAKRPGLHSWVTSTSWSNMDAMNIKEMHGNIYTSKVNGIIPWAGIQRPAHWPKKDPNPGTAIRVNEDGTYEVTRGYYFYKQLTRAGQPGMKIAETMAMNSEVAVIGFHSNGTKNPDAIVVANISNEAKKISLHLKGAASSAFHLYRTVWTEGGDQEMYKDHGTLQAANKTLLFEMPPGSVCTFFAEEK